MIAAAARTWARSPTSGPQATGTEGERPISPASIGITCARRPSDLTRVLQSRMTPLSKVKAVAASLKRFGWQQAIVADPKGVIVAGETRYKAAVSLGWTSAPV